MLRLQVIPKLKAINYRIRDDDYVMSSVQFVFDTGLESPMFDSPAASASGWAIRSVVIDPSKVIGGIGMKSHEGKDLRGIRFLDESGEIFHETVWCIHSDEGVWTHKDIPVGQRIVGLQCAVRKSPSDGKYKDIGRLAFLLSREESHEIPLHEQELVKLEEPLEFLTTNWAYEQEYPPSPFSYTAARLN